MVHREQDDYNRQGESPNTPTHAQTHILPLSPLFGLLCTLKAITLNIVSLEQTKNVKLVDYQLLAMSCSLVY